MFTLRTLIDGIAADEYTPSAGEAFNWITAEQVDANNWGVAVETSYQILNEDGDILAEHTATPRP